MKLYYSWNQFGLDVGKLAKKLAPKKKKFDGVWGPARGGLPIAVCLSHELGLPFLARPKSKKTLVVDDIADTGATLFKYAKAGYFIATIFYHRQSKYVPKIWLREKKNQWVVFPWEKR